MRIEEAFGRLKARQEAALVVYLTAGYPTKEGFIHALKEAAEAGADLIEIGLPFSDPIADGPAIQRASQVGLANGVTLGWVLETISPLSLEIPLVLMSYLNPLIAYGADSLFPDLLQAGITGVIVPDLPVEEADGWIVPARLAAVDTIFLVAPTSPAERIRRNAEASTGFVYAVSLTGTTGARKTLPKDLEGFLQRIRAVTDKPVALGFGIATPDHVRAVRGMVDGVIVGSRVIEALENQENLTTLVRALKAATKG